MNYVLLTAAADRPDALKRALETADELSRRDVAARVVEIDRLGEESIPVDSLVVSLGGDGTFLRAAHFAHRYRSRILPVHLGRIGFLLNVPTEEITQAVVTGLSSTASVERLALAIRVGDDPVSYFALNEVVLERFEAGRMVRVLTYVDDEEYLTYTADSVMVATPTGSTAYNFSAGGPVVDSALDVLILTPVAPHFTIDRSIVVSGERTVRLSVRERPANVVVDGRLLRTLQPNEVLEVTRQSDPVRVVYSSAFELGHRLRTNLREGHA
ncbi:MAG: NAD(+)/NADH kinase [Acidimicrobiaceae bacterium]|nr:NAD(+)/NADH kinase [Acidimicrobiaceae bacterium]